MDEISLTCVSSSRRVSHEENCIKENVGKEKFAPLSVPTISEEQDRTGGIREKPEHSWQRKKKKRLKERES